MKQKIDTETKQNPKLLQRELKDGRISLYLEYYLGRAQEPILDVDGNPVYYEGTNRQKYKVYHIRKKENLEIYLVSKPTKAEDKAENKEKIFLANEIRTLREQEMRAGKIGYRFAAKSQNLHDFIRNYIDEYKGADKRMVICAYGRFCSFLREKYSLLEKVVSPESLTPLMMEKFVSYLKENGVGEGPNSYYKRWKRILEAARKEHIIQENPCNGIRCSSGDESFKKDVLSAEEVVRLLNTTYKGLNSDVRRAFGFSLYSGVRFVDVKLLTYSCVDIPCGKIRFEQAKTKGHSANSRVELPLSPMLLKFIGDIPEDTNQHIFKLPSHTMCLKALRNWTKLAGINKHITWHCARHTFATLVLTNGANAKVTAELLGHSSMKYVERYVRALDSAKADAVNSLPTV